MEKKADRSIATRSLVPGAPNLPGLAFRGFQGEEDYPMMVAVLDESRQADGVEWVETLEGITNSYSHLLNSDPSQDMLFAKMNQQIIGYSRVWWSQIVDGPRAYGHFAFMVPEWRGKGIRRAMLRHNEHRIREIAEEHHGGSEKVYEAWASDGERDWIGILEDQGYTPARYEYDMVRPTTDSIPDAPLPQGLEVRPVRPEHVPAIWDAAREAFRDHWGFSEEEWSTTTLEELQHSDIYRPELWQVAWERSEVCGMVLNFISEKENERFGRKRGYTETICVRRPWRRRGLARALIARSIRMHADLGMTEVALGVDADNPNGALQLYLSMGYRTVKRGMCYRKPLDSGSTIPKGDQYAYHL
jgi:GNAT superfamily N-acetyltransferase